MTGLVVCTSPTFGKYTTRAEEMLTEAGLRLERVSPDEARDPEIMKTRLEDAAALIAGAFKIPREVMEAAPGLKVMTKHGTGVDHFDLDAARDLGVVVANAPGLNADAVADLALGLMLAAARKIPFSERGARRGEWKPVMGVELKGKTLSVIGMGAIGRGLIKRAAGFDMKFMAYDPWLDADFAAKHGVRAVESLEEALVAADFLSLHLPLNDQTRGLMNEDRFKIMKPTAYIINTARGGVIDQEALVEALREEWIAGAGLDVLAQEPPNQNDPLLNMDNVIVTQHMGAYTEEAMASISLVCSENVIRVLDGREPLYRVA